MFLFEPLGLIDLQVEPLHHSVSQFNVEILVMRVWRVFQDLRQHDVIFQKPLEGKDDVSPQGELRLGLDLTFVQLFLQLRISQFLLLQASLGTTKVGAVLFVDVEMFVKLEDDLADIILPVVQLEQNVRVELDHLIQLEENKLMKIFREKGLEGSTEVVLDHYQVGEIFVLRLSKLLDWKLSLAFLGEGNVKIHPRLSGRADCLIDVIVDLLPLLLVSFHWSAPWTPARGVDRLAVIIPKTLVDLFLRLDLLLQLLLFLWESFNKLKLGNNYYILFYLPFIWDTVNFSEWDSTDNVLSTCVCINIICALLATIRSYPHLQTVSFQAWI